MCVRGFTQRGPSGGCSRREGLAVVAILVGAMSFLIINGTTGNRLGDAAVGAPWESGL